MDKNYKNIILKGLTGKKIVWRFQWAQKVLLLIVPSCFYNRLTSVKEPLTHPVGIPVDNKKTMLDFIYPRNSIISLHVSLKACGPARLSNAYPNINEASYNSHHQTEKLRSHNSCHFHRPNLPHSEHCYHSPLVGIHTAWRSSSNHSSHHNLVARG